MQAKPRFDIGDQVTVNSYWAGIIVLTIKTVIITKPGRSYKVYYKVSNKHTNGGSLTEFSEKEVLAMQVTNSRLD